MQSTVEQGGIQQEVIIRPTVGATTANVSQGFICAEPAGGDSLKPRPVIESESLKTGIKTGAFDLTAATALDRLDFQIGHGRQRFC